MVKHGVRNCVTSYVLLYYLVTCLNTLITTADTASEVVCGHLTDGVPGKEPQSGRISLSTSDHVICTGHWSDENAQVYCRQNRFSYGIALYYNVKPGQTDDTPDKKSKKSISCTGSEDKLSDCSLTEEGLCGDLYVGGVLCYDSKQFSPIVELDGRRYPGTDKASIQGVVGLSLEGQIGSVSSEGWRATKEARTLCRMFSYSRGRVTESSVPGTGPIMYGVRCNGNEDSLFKCTFDGWHKSGNHSKDVHVNCSHADTCSPHDPIPYTQLTADPMAEYPDGHVITFQCVGGYIPSDRTDSSVGKYTCIDGHWYGTNITCQTIQDGEVSLVEGLPTARAATGLVLVAENQVNKSICTADWNPNSAEVVCREKGFGYSYAIRMTNTDQPYLTSTYKCKGGESNLTQCENTDTVNCNAGAKGVAGGVICYNSPAYPPKVSRTPPNVSVVDGGLVVIVTSDQKMGICNKNWTDREAMVVCKEWGFRNGSVHDYQVKGVGTYLYASFKCSGEESHLLDCEMGGWIPASECGNNTQNAQVKCRYKEPLTDYQMNLTDGLPGHMDISGRLLIAQNNAMKSICPEMMTEAVANVSCHKLGLEGGIPLRYNKRTDPVFSGHLDCQGTEMSLDKCTYNATPQTCPDGGTKDAGILCYPKEYYKPTVQLNVDPKKGLTDQGLVTLTVNGMVGTVCSDTWDKLDAGVFCRELDQGFVSGEPKDFGMIGINYALKGVACTGKESSLFECDISEWVIIDKDNPSCKSAQVQCFKQVTTTPKPTTEKPPETPKSSPTTSPAPANVSSTTASPSTSTSPTTSTTIPENGTTTDNDTEANDTDTSTTVLPTTAWSNETETNETTSGNSTADGVDDIDDVDDDDDANEDSGSSLTIPVSITCVVVVLLIIAGAFIYRKRRQHQQLMGYVRYNNEDITPSVVSREETDTVMIRDPARGQLDVEL